MPFTIIQQDITKMDVDAIVNAANTDLIAGGGVCGAVFKAAGARELQEACCKVAPIKTGSVAITPGFSLKAKYIIHAVGPIYSQWSAEKNEILLRSAYTESLRIAQKNGCESIAFPLISSGIYGYPKDEALRVAVCAIRDYLSQNELDVYLAIFDKDSFAISEKLLWNIDCYIDEHYAGDRIISRRTAASKPCVQSSDNKDLRQINFDDAFDDIFRLLDKHLMDKQIMVDAPFSDTLLKLIDSKGRSDVEVYKRANIDRKLFSKIRTGNGYIPGKKTVIALAIALELNLDETEKLLKCAGYALSHSLLFDVIIIYFITNEMYDIFEINEVLFLYDQQLLGG